MKPEAQRIAIAEKCGWQIYHEYFDEKENKIVRDWHPPAEECDETLVIIEEDLPDYLTDLNAMHEAEHGLSGDKMTKYWHHLFDICRRYQGSISAPTVIYMVSATAAQRAEAFLRTLGKWTI